MFKVGIGPSSSHTVGPMRAAADFVGSLGSRGLLLSVRRVQVELYGSLALTGEGHGTDRAVLLGLCGEVPERVDPLAIEARLGALRASGSLLLRGVQAISFDESSDLIFLKDQTLPGHSNAVRFRAFDGGRTEVARQVYYSIGGGFIVREGEDAS